MPVHEMTLRTPLKTNELLEMVRQFYERNPAGGNLHVCLDDGNMEDGNVWWCLQEAAKHKDLAAVQIACWLLALSEEDRFDFYDQYGQYAW
jgi:hypothetical protein